MIEIPELFERSTLKSVDSIFDLEEEKRRVRVYLESGEWFTLAGLRRVGKTTLVRSVAASLGVPVVYINVWELPRKRRDLFGLFDETVRRITNLFSGTLRSIGRRVREVSLFGVKLVFDTKEMRNCLSELLERIIARKSRFIWIVDEVQELRGDFADFVEYLAAIHDRFAPNLVVVLLGSVISLKNLIERVGGLPMLGRITKELILMPFSKNDAVKYLLKGFEIAGLDVPFEMINLATEYFGGFVGWLAEFGRTLIQEYNIMGTLPKPEEVLEKIYSNARRQIYLEVSRLIDDRRNLEGYIKVLTYTATNLFVSPSQIAEILKIKRNTAMKYLKYLEERALIIHKEHKYMIADPLIRRALAEPDAKEQIFGFLKEGR